LVIINKNIPFNIEWGNLNNFDKFGETYGLYNGKTLDGFNFIPISVSDVNEYNPNSLTAFNYIQSLNNLNTRTVYDTYINYYMIDKDGNFAKTEMVRFNDTEGNNRFRDLPNWDKKYPPFYIESVTASPISLKKDSYNITPLKGPETNIYDKYLVYSDRRPIKESYIDQPLARIIEKNEVDKTKNAIFHGESISNTNTINRFLGYYEPIFKDLNIFKPTYYWVDGDDTGSIKGNYSFNTTLEQFGVIDEVMHSKVNEDNNYLKLRNNDIDRSYYPMVDEVGVSQTDRFVFLSPWDRKFYLKTLNEQTFLQDYVQTPLAVVTTPTFAQILSSTIINGFDETTTTFSNGINLYGWLRTTNVDPSNSGLTYSVTIQNLSSSSKSFGFKMNFISNYGTTPTIYDSGSETFTAGQTRTFNFEEKRPDEVKSNNSGGVFSTNLPPFALFNIRYVLYEISGNQNLDTYQINTINIYNDLVDPILTGATFEDGLTNNHFVGSSYDFGIILSDGIEKTSYNYTIKLFIQRYPGNAFDYWEAATTTGTKSGSIDKNITINVNLINSQLGNVPSNDEYDATIRWEVIYDYTIEGQPKTETDIKTYSNYKIINSSLVANKK
ncbi:MAG: hypothetical protein ACOC3V_05005, partial [bacterium]